MSTTNQHMTLRGFDKDDQTISNPCDVKRQQPFSKVVKGLHFGMPISRKKFFRMIHRFWHANKPGAQNPFSNLACVDFSKASILRVLAQEKVEFIRFHFVIPDKDQNVASLALEGLNANGHPVKPDKHKAALKSFVESLKNGKENDATSSGDGDDDSDNEEMGNGSGSHGKVCNIIFASEIINELTATGKMSFTEAKIQGNDHPFEDFMHHFYEYAQQKHEQMK